MKTGDLIYHPKVVYLSFKVYEISANLGFAVMPKLPEDRPIERRLTRRDDITKHLEDS